MVKRVCFILGDFYHNKKKRKKEEYLCIKWQPTPVFLPRESHGQRSLTGHSPQDHKSRT